MKMADWALLKRVEKGLVLAGELSSVTPISQDARMILDDAFTALGKLQTRILIDTPDAACAAQD